MVPHDPRGLFTMLGGKRRATVRLRHFFERLDAVGGSSDTPSAALSNEPTLHTPFLFNWLGRPDLTSVIEHRALGQLFNDGPTGLPGNDDLGSLSSWYVFGSLGMYPEVPGVGLLALSAPRFPAATLHLAGGDVTIAAPGAESNPHVASMTLNGQPYDSSWISFCQLAGGAQIGYTMGPEPGPQWGRGPANEPPSFSPRRAAPGGFCET
jgi:putative alpha-1,2-mannosidase